LKSFLDLDEEIGVGSRRGRPGWAEHVGIGLPGCAGTREGRALGRLDILGPLVGVRRGGNR